MKSLNSKTIDLILTIPPSTEEFSKKRHTNDKFSNFILLQHYKIFTEKWVIEAKRLLSDEGVIVLECNYDNVFMIASVSQEFGLRIIKLTVIHSGIFLFITKGVNRDNLVCDITDSSFKNRYNDILKTQKLIPEKKYNLLDIFIINDKIISTAKNNNWNYSGFSRNKYLIQKLLNTISDNKIEKTIELKTIKKHTKKEHNYKKKKKLDTTGTKRNLTRIQFSDLVICGMLPVGDNLTSKNSEHLVTILEDGRLQLSESGIIKSINKMCEFIEKKNKCNGWNYWYYKNTLISEIKKQYIKDIK